MRGKSPVSVDVLDRQRCDLGEGPAWDDRTGEVLWVDIMGRAVHALALDSGARRSLATPTPVGAVIPTAGERLLVALEAGPALLADTGEVEQLAAYAGAEGFDEAVPLRSNDAKCDPRGRCLVGTMAYDARPGAASLFRLDAGARTLVRLLADLTIANGLGWSPDGRTMYYVDSPTRRVDVWDYDLDAGTLANRRTLVELPESAGLPDGLAVDADGCVWVALWGGSAVHRYTPDGRLDRAVHLPCAQVTSCAFVGPALDRLVITSASQGLERPEPLAGATFVVDVGVAGLPVGRFAA